MKKNTITILSAVIIGMTGSSCSKKIELSPISNISDANFWKTAEQFDAFVTGVHISFRTHTSAFQALGELRSDIYGLEPAASQTFTGEATQGLERFWLQQLDLDNAGVGNFGGTVTSTGTTTNFYYNINQINLLIEKLNNTEIVTAANKAHYLGIAYGMRAYYYFQLTRAWGKVIIQTDPVASVDISSLAKAASSTDDVMKLIKADIDASANSFGADFSIRNTKSFWSKAATLMLKAEVYLWTSYRGGGTGDATIAKNALTEIQTSVPGLALITPYASIFGSNNKGNNEMIFAIRNRLDEATLPFAGTFFPQSGLIANFYDSVANRKFNVTADNWGGLLRAPVTVATFRKFDDKDSRKWATIQPGYSFTGGVYRIAGAFVKKYEGEQNAGIRQFTNDFPIYRYADLLLLLGEAKLALGESPATEINLVRQRAYGNNFVANVHGYPNQSVDTNPKEAILQERLFEFIFEGKRWHDLRRMGDAFVYAHTPITAAQAYKLLWPIDRNSLTNNRSLEQTPGYPNF